MTKQKLLLDWTLSLFLIVACEAQQLPRGHVAASSGPLCEKEAESWGNLFSSERLDAWICSLIGSFMVGLSGVFPLLVIPFETGAALRSEGKSATRISLSKAQVPGCNTVMNRILSQKYCPLQQAILSGALAHTWQFDRESSDKCKPWTELVQRVLFVLHPA